MSIDSIGVRISPGLMEWSLGTSLGSLRDPWRSPTRSLGVLGGLEVLPLVLRQSVEATWGVLKRFQGASGEGPGGVENIRSFLGASGGSQMALAVMLVV